jgi:hypothetical protein
VQPLHLLAASRAIQYVMSCGSPVRFEDLEIFLSNGFKYRINVLGPLIDELIMSGIFRSVPGDDGSAASVDTTTRDQFHISRLLPSIEYLALTSYTAPFPVGLVRSGKYPVRLYGSLECVVHSKIISGVNSARLISSMDSLEEREFAGNMQAVTGVKTEKSFERYGFNIADRIKDNVYRQSSLIINRAADAGSERLFDSLEEALTVEKNW